MSAYSGNRQADTAETAYQDSDGRIWRYSGKRARVLEMLVERGEGVTQHDCYPWHTRLGGTIHTMRKDGLAISTELEGPYRHARYRLATKLLAASAPCKHRRERLINNQRKSNVGIAE